MGDVLEVVVHVGAGVNIEVLSLPVGDLELVVLCNVGVLPQVGRDDGSVGP